MLALRVLGLFCGAQASTMECVLLDTSRFPMIVVRWDRQGTDEDLELFIRVYDEQVRRADREHRHYVVVSIGDADWGPKQRKRMAAWMEAHLDAKSPWDLGSHVVVHGAIARGSLTAIKWLVPRFEKIYVHADELAAMAAAKASLDQADTKRAG